MVSLFSHIKIRKPKHKIEKIEAMEKQKGLIKAVEENRKEKVERFIKEGANLDFKDRFGTPLLHFAPNDGDVTIVKLLMQNGVDINAKDTYGTTKLMQVCACGNIELQRIAGSAKISARCSYTDFTIRFASYVRDT